MPETQNRADFQVFCVLPTFGPRQYSPFRLPPPPPSFLPVPGRENTKSILLPFRWPRYGLADTLPVAMRPLTAADRLTGITAVTAHPLFSAGWTWANEWTRWPDGPLGATRWVRPPGKGRKGSELVIRHGWTTADHQVSMGRWSGYMTEVRVWPQNISGWII